MTERPGIDISVVALVVLSVIGALMWFDAFVIGRWIWMALR
jgi:hypothetical protein